jgi:single-strand DNA-binding protein
MSSRGLNLCTLSGHVAADPEVRTIERKAGGTTQVANFTIYVDRIPSRKESDSFTVKITLWEDSAAWRKLPYIKKGSLIIASGAIDASPYISKTDAQAQAGLQLKAIDLFLDAPPRSEDAREEAKAAAEPPKVLAMADF